MPNLTRRVPMALAVVALALYVNASPVAAQVATDGNASPDAPIGTVFTVNNVLVTLLLGAVAPLVTGFLLRPENPPVVKVLVAGLVGTVFQAISQVVQEDGTAALSQEWFVGLALLLAAQLGSYARIWNPVFASKGGVNAATGPGVIGPRPRLA